MLKDVEHKQLLQASSKNTDSKPFIFLGFDILFENSEKNFSEKEVIL